jgi:hypothetical protein
LLLEIAKLRKEESQLVNQETKCLEDLLAYKRDKTFLDLLAISVEKKQIQVKAGTAYH